MGSHLTLTHHLAHFSLSMCIESAYSSSSARGQRDDAHRAHQEVGRAGPESQSTHVTVSPHDSRVTQTP